MKKLPKVYQNEINKPINNNKTVCYLRDEKDLTRGSINSNNIESQLDTIFNGMGYSYNIPVMIRTKNRTYDTSLIAKTSNNVVTLDNDIIAIPDILGIDIKR